MNGALALIVVGELCGIAIVWLQPCLKRQIADWFNASADGDDWRAIQHNKYKSQREKDHGIQ